MTITKNLHNIKQELPDQVLLVAVSKTKPVEDLQEAYTAGQRVFGENKVQELEQKWSILPKDIQWHMIGHLQTNKVKYIAPFVHLIHAVDSLKLLKTINKEAQKNNRTINCLLQFHIADEQTKFGLSLEEAQQLLTSSEYLQLENIKIVGVMGMATFTNDTTQVRNEFKTLKSIFQQLKNTIFVQQPDFKEISMGMSGDYAIAIEEGSTMIRVGSNIFGSRY